MIREYLKTLKKNGDLSWQDISKASGLPEVTIRKIFSGETEDPRFETVVRLVSAMGGSLAKINEIDKVEAIEKSEESEMKALIAVKEVYEERIREIKTSAADQISSLKRDKKLLAIAACVLGLCLVGILLFDILVGSTGWIQY